LVVWHYNQIEIK